MLRVLRARFGGRRPTGAGTVTAMHYKYEDFVDAVAKRLRELREERGYSKRRFALEHGYFLSHWHKIESGEKMSLQTLLRAANSFDLSVEELINSARRYDGPGVGSKGFGPTPSDRKAQPRPNPKTQLD